MIIEGLGFTDISPKKKFLAVRIVEDGRELQTAEGTALSLIENELKNTTMTATLLDFCYRAELGETKLIERDKFVIARIK